MIGSSIIKSESKRGGGGEGGWDGMGLMSSGIPY
jgi:hypothetical protein